MPKLTFYRQQRIDGGIRTGIELDGETIYGLFEEGEEEVDPRLVWYVDLRCEGPRLPQTTRGARKWLLDQAPMISDGFVRCAREIRAGIDPDIYPLFWDKFPDAPSGTRLKIALCAVRRVAAIEMSGVVAEIGSHWTEYVRALKPPLSVRHL
jgi:hypothetical protein